MFWFWESEGCQVVFQRREIDPTKGVRWLYRWGRPVLREQNGCQVLSVRQVRVQDPPTRWQHLLRSQRALRQLSLQKGFQSTMNLDSIFIVYWYCLLVQSIPRKSRARTSICRVPSAGWNSDKDKYSYLSLMTALSRQKWITPSLLPMPKARCQPGRECKGQTRLIINCSSPRRARRLGRVGDQILPWTGFLEMEKALYLMKDITTRGLISWWQTMYAHWAI